MEPSGLAVATPCLQPLPQRVVVEGISTETAQLEGREEVPLQILALIRVERELQTKVLLAETQASIIPLRVVVVRVRLEVMHPRL